MFSANESIWLRLWAPRIAGVIYLSLTLFLLAGYYGSWSDLPEALAGALVPALGTTVLVLASGLVWRDHCRRSSPSS